MSNSTTQSPNPLSKADYETLAAFRYALRGFIHFSESAAQAEGIAPQQHQALLAIKGFPGCEQITVGELAERLKLRHHSAVELVDRLVAEKLAVRRGCKEDHRRVLIELTGRGDWVLEKLSWIHRKEIERIGPELAGLLERFGHSLS
jgi:DNA-binding MarR family transcriptional regulator